MLWKASSLVYYEQGELGLLFQYLVRNEVRGLSYPYSRLKAANDVAKGDEFIFSVQ